MIYLIYKAILEGVKAPHALRNLALQLLRGELSSDDDGKGTLAKWVLIFNMH